MGLRSTNKVWKKDETAALIALFETERCLYDDKDKNYRDTEKQIEAYKRICKIMVRIRPDCSVDEIKYRIKFLRRQYEGELLHRNISVHSGLCTKDAYKPGMWCFDLLQFLDEFLVEKNNMDGEGSSDTVDESDENEDAEKISRKKRRVESSSSEREMQSISPSLKKLQSTSSERKLQNLSERKFQSVSVSEKKFQRTSSEKKFQSTSSERRLHNTSSSERRLQTPSSSERRLQNPSSSERRLQNPSSSERRLQNTSSSDRKMHISSSSESELKNSSENEFKNSPERDLKHSSSSEREFKNSSTYVGEMNSFSPERELPNTSKKIADVTENIAGQSSVDREDIFGQYVASELRALRSNPLLYLQTKQSILESLTSANFELINPE